MCGPADSPRWGPRNGADATSRLASAMLRGMQRQGLTDQNPADHGLLPPQPPPRARYSAIAAFRRVNSA